MNDAVERFSKIVGQIYEASMSPEYWPIALKSLCKELNASKAQMLYIEPEERMLSFVCGYGFDPYKLSLGTARFRRYIAEDPVALYGVSHQNEVFSDSRVIDAQALHQSSMQKNVRAPMGMRYMLSVYLTSTAESWTGLCFFRDYEEKAFTSDDEKILERFLPHLDRATNIHKSISGASNINSMQHGILNNLDTPLLVLNDQYEVIICNLAAKKAIDSSGVLKLSNRSRLSCANLRENTLLFQAIDGAFSGEASPAEFRRFAVRLSGRGYTESIIAVVTPLQSRAIDEKIQTLPLSASHFTAKIPNSKNVLIALCNPIVHKKIATQ